MTSRLRIGILHLVLVGLLGSACAAWGLAGAAENPAGTSPGCAKAADQAVPDDSKDPIGGGRGPLAKPRLQGLEVSPDDAAVDALGIEPLVPPFAPPGTQLRLSLMSPWGDGGPNEDTRFIQVFGAGSVAGLSVWEIVDRGGWILYEGPPRGRDATSVQAVLESLGTKGRSVVIPVGPYDALLVHGDRISSVDGTTRPYALYWSDGSRDLSLEAPGNSAAAIGFARSLYCPA